MFIVKIQYPGCLIKHADAFFVSKIQRLFGGMETNLMEAIHCFNEFKVRKDFIDREYKNFPKFDVFTRSLPFFYAKSFIFALDGIGKILTQLAKLSETEDVPATIVDIKNDFYSHFTDLTALRNSFHHFEDRLQGKAFGNPIILQETDHELFDKPSKALMLGVLSGNRYSCTSADGSLPFIEISEANLVKAAEFIQKTINEFNWHPNPIKTFP